MSSRNQFIKRKSFVPFSMYDAFTEVPYSGSQAAVVLSAADINISKRTQIARELGLPATAFVDNIHGNRVKAQFFSTVMELQMCGHGTVCLVTHLVAQKLLSCEGKGWHNVTLVLPQGGAGVEYRQTAAGRVEVMLDVQPPSFCKPNFKLDELMGILGIGFSEISRELVPEIASGDFVHLCLPMCDLAAMQDLTPDFDALAKFCISNGLETVATFCNAAVDKSCDLHVRDFCPAVGVAESAAAGTTNAALSAYFFRHGLIKFDTDGTIQLRAEQGIELGRPSQVTTRIEKKNGSIKRLQVGGLASCILEGTLNLGLQEKRQ